MSRSDSRCSPPWPCSGLPPPARSDPPLHSSIRFLYLAAFGYRRLERDVTLVVRMEFHLPCVWPPHWTSSSLCGVRSLASRLPSWAAPSNHQRWTSWNQGRVNGSVAEIPREKGKKRVLGKLAFDERDYHCRVRSTAPGGLQREKERLVCAKVIPYSHLSELGTLSPPGSSWRWPTCSF